MPIPGRYEKNSMKEIISALEECQKLKKTSLVRSDRKYIFAKFGQHVMYTCARVQVSRNATGILDYNAYMDQLSDQHLSVIMKLMRHTDYCFEAVADNKVNSHLYHAKILFHSKQ